MNLAITLTLSRLLIFAPLAAVFVYLGYWFLAAAMIIIGLVTDALDGYLARKRNEVTRLGSTLDGAADKIFFLLIVIALFFRYDLPAYYLLILIRDILVGLISLVIIMFYEGFKSMHMHARISGKIVTMFQSVTIVLVVFKIWGYVSAVIVDVFIGFTFLSAMICVIDYTIAFFRGTYHKKHIEFLQAKKYRNKQLKSRKQSKKRKR